MLIDPDALSQILQTGRIIPGTKSSMCNNCSESNPYYALDILQQQTIQCNHKYLVVKPNCMAHVSRVLRKCGALHNNFVCDHISPISIFISLGFRMLKARTDLLVRREMVLMLSRSFRLLIYINRRHEQLFCMRFVFSLRCKLTGYSVFPFPVFSVYMYLRISSASSVSPHSMRNFGLSGKKNSQQPSNKLK